MGLFLAPPKPLNEKAADVLQEMLEMLFIFLERCHFLAESEKKNNPPERESYFRGSNVPAEPEFSWKVGKPDSSEEENLTHRFLSQEGVYPNLAPQTAANPPGFIPCAPPERPVAPPCPKG